MTISAAGFGHQISWEDEEAPPGHDISFKRSIEIVGTGVFIRALCPKWLLEWAPTRKIREVRDGFAEFRVRSPRTGILRLSLNSKCAVISSGDDQRAKVLRREGREEGSPLESRHRKRRVLGRRRTEARRGGTHWYVVGTRAVGTSVYTSTVQETCSCSTLLDTR